MSQFHPFLDDDGVLLVASLEDLFANKLKVIVQRAEKKDYLDIEALIRAGVSLPKALAAAELMFYPEFQSGIALKALTYFEDGDLPSLPQSSKEFLAKSAATVGDLPEVDHKKASLGCDHGA